VIRSSAVECEKERVNKGREIFYLHNLYVVLQHVCTVATVQYASGYSTVLKSSQCIHKPGSLELQNKLIIVENGSPDPLRFPLLCLSSE